MLLITFSSDFVAKKAWWLDHGLITFGIRTRLFVHKRKVYKLHADHLRKATIDLERNKFVVIYLENFRSKIGTLSR